jgi:WD40-like Beta Propeller Repeat
MVMRTQRRPGALGWLAVGVGALALALPATGEATFPGRNGEIVYGWSGESSYRGGPTHTSIRAVDPRSGRVRVLRDCPLNADPPPVHTDCIVSVPRYSPDGLRVAFPTIQVVPHYTGEPWEFRPGLATMASDGTGLVERASVHSYGGLAWSPAGDRFLLEREGIFLASLDGTELSQVTPRGTGAPDWSSTGQIAFARSRVSCLRVCSTISNIYLTRLGGTSRRLTYRGGYSPSWSPHGTKLAFARHGNKRQAGVYLVRRDGRGLRRLTRGGYSPSWSPDGKWIAFIRAGDLYVIRTNGRGRRRLLDELWYDGEGPRVNSIDWQPLP